MSEIAIRVENLGKQYKIGRLQKRNDTLRDAIVSTFQRSNVERYNTDTIWALRDVSFEVKRGEVVGIIGRNGAGKSTLLKILSRITEPTTGTVDIYGRVGSLLEVGTGFHPELTGRENIFLNGAILGMRRAEIQKKFDEIVAFAEVEKFIDTPVKRYSSGMYVRLAFAVAAHLEPEILVVDEVLAVGDASFQKKCLGKMGDVAREGRTVLFVSHNMGAVKTLCTIGLVLESGKISATGHIENCVYQYSSEVDGVKGNYWKRAQESQSQLSLQTVSVQIEGEQPHLLLKIDISASSQAQHKDAFVAIDIVDSVGTPVMQVLPAVHPFIIFRQQKHRISLVVDLPPLIPGHYFLSVWVGSHNTETLDWVEKCASFDIVESPIQGSTFPHTTDHGHILPNTIMTYK